MGFNKRIIPNLERLEKIYNEDPDSYIRGIIKADALIGPIESIKWVDEKIKEYNDKRTPIK